MSEIYLELTRDGSHTLVNPGLDEGYHAFAGAFTESVYVYIEKGLATHPINNNVKILEVGFGTGLNAALSYQHCQQAGAELYFHTLEPFPISAQLAAKLNYPEFLEDAGKQVFNALHQAPWQQQTDITSDFRLYKDETLLTKATLPEGHFDLVYFDAFAPKKQPSVWTMENLEQCHRALKVGGMLVSYCANGQFKRNLKALGFKLEQCEGPMGRKEMTRAIKL
ncbi:tRNA (5-methylaminomethyl-2-thiouridine)(34)-methyltransferase MnmD [Paraferrimonas sp. SM1919]|uniref:tRNA (5-methylaminomethyl-2-thiouridine)(34)-methyltransferase MnmD n=1 Tax=Paraferrimonas sp. SM1919 TaxID=2662263 RepID=UPI0013D35A0E|nr:tRNA (5-methylaminomethyl-2-thiouridine)(34)-methyltransferase MnmD [Paraferrimonas sp. SM1919]